MDPRIKPAYQRAPMLISLTKPVCSFRRNLYVGLCCAAGFGLTITGCTSSAQSSSDEAIVHQVGEFEIGPEEPLELDPELAEAVSRAVNRYTASPDVANCTELTQWYVDGLEVALQGEIIEILRATSSIDVASQSLPRVSGALKGKMIDTLRQNEWLCPREPDFDNSTIAIPELKSIAREALRLMEKTGVYYSIDASTVLRLAIDIAEGRPLVFEYNRVDTQSVN